MRVWWRSALVATFLLALFLAAGPSEAENPGLRDASEALLSDFAAEERPWTRIEAGSEQMPPMYLGPSPREQALREARTDRPAIARRLKRLGEAHAATLLEKLGLEAAELEAWPVEHWRGYWTWAFARYRTAGEAWRWIPAAFARRNDFEAPMPELPAHYLPWKRSRDEAAVFQDFLESSDLYDKPRFGECVWTDATGGKIAAAWLPPAERESRREAFLAARYHAYAIAQPARWNARPVTFVLPVGEGGVLWPKSIAWRDEEEPVAAPIALPTQVAVWPADLEERYRADVAVLAGERFTRKSCAQPDHQLVDLVRYLEKRYAALGIRTRRQTFSWRGIEQANLVAEIPGRLDRARNRPVLIADHIDTVFAEDTFEETGERVTTAGANDNASATAALLAAAGVVQERASAGKLAHDVWLVHFTGEEFPPDCLGARRFVERLLAEKQDIGGLVLLDMIGYRKAGDRVFQVNAGSDAESLRLAGLALGAAVDVAPELRAAFRSRFDDKSYLYNTDGIIFSDAGYPVVFLDEHIHSQKMRNPYYHQSSDVPENLDVEYALGITKVAIETALRAAAGKAP